MININCLGSGEGLRIGNGEGCPDLYRAVQDLNEAFTHFTLPPSGRGRGADAEPFSAVGIPTFSVATAGGYAHLHHIGDTPETLNPPLFEKAARLAFLTLWEMANH